MSDLLLDTVEKHEAGEAVGVYSVCSSHPLVIEASFCKFSARMATSWWRPRRTRWTNSAATQG